MDSLSDKLWIDLGVTNKKHDDPMERVAVALQKALDNTTPARAGTPWDTGPRKESNVGGVEIYGDDRDDTGRGIL